MGRDKIRHLNFIHGRWRWRPSKSGRAAGFRSINLSHGFIIDGEHVPSAADKARAAELNDAWDRARRGIPDPTVAAAAYPTGSIGHAFLQAMRMREQERAMKGIVWTKEQHSRDDWPRAWRWIEPLFGRVDPKTVRFEHLMGDPSRPEVVGLRPLVASKVSESEAYRCIKVWRALWKRMAVLGLCNKDRDPSLLFANPAPQPRQATWSEGEAVRLVKGAWRAGYHGLAALLAVAWDSQLSPIDARRLREQQMRQDRSGTWFEVARAKTGRAAIATLCRRSERVLEAYRGVGDAQRLGSVPIFRNRSGAPYSKDTLGDDFRAVRAIAFGPGETRQLADFRRSGTVEALTGHVEPSSLSAKMANSISESNRLHKTYGPVQLASVRQADEARKVGRRALREQRPYESFTAPDQEVSQKRSVKAKPLK